jgi:hypothetical protein
MDAQDDGPVSAELLIREVTPSPTGNLTFSLPQCMI